MSRILRWATAPLVVVTATVTLATPAWAETYSGSLRTAVAGLPVATEVRTGYSRSLFPHWIDADGDGCNTRYEVLIAEATTQPTVGSGCTLSGGRWYSYYDNATWTEPADLDIDHLVPLAEAWDSGARTWTTSRRQSYANDLGDSRGPSSRSPTTSTRPRATRTRRPGCPRTVRRAAGTSTNGSR